MDMGELLLSLLGGDDEGLMLNDKPRRQKLLLALSLSSTLEGLNQGTFTGMLQCRGRGEERRGAKRGGGGRGGGDRVELPAAVGS